MTCQWKQVAVRMTVPVIVRKPRSDSTSNSCWLPSIGSNISESSMALLVEPTERILLATSPSCRSASLLTLNSQGWVRVDCKVAVQGSKVDLGSKMVGSALVVHREVGILKLSLSNVQYWVSVYRTAVVQQHCLCSMAASSLSLSRQCTD